MASVWANFKGRCKGSDLFQILCKILEICDIGRVLLLALWVPREYNQLADFLSHLSCYVSRQSISGSDIPNRKILFNNITKDMITSCPVANTRT